MIVPTVLYVFFYYQFFRPTDLELHLSEKASKKVEEDMGYIKLQAKLVPKTQEEKEQVGSKAGDQQEAHVQITVIFIAVRMTILRWNLNVAFFCFCSKSIGCEYSLDQ